MKTLKNELGIKMIVAGILVNFAVAAIVSLLKFPIYLDAIGTIIITLTMGRKAGIITGIIGFILMTITGIGPFHIYFIGTQIAIALFIDLMARKSMLKNTYRVIITGLTLGLICALTSAPIIVYLFGGIEGNGAGIITAFLIKTGNTIIESVLYKGISIEPIDKTIQCLIVFYTLKSMSKQQLKKLDSINIRKNFTHEE